MTIKKHYRLLLLFVLSTFLFACGGGSTDDGGENPTPSTSIDTSTFNGTWFGPCFNNGFGYSVAQTLTINGNALISDIISYPVADCLIPSDTSSILGEANVTLNYGNSTAVTACSNNQAQETALTISTFESSGDTFTVKENIDNAIALLSGYIDLIPDSTNICLNDNGNLLFAGTEYLGTGPNTVITSPPDSSTNTNVTWTVDSNTYVAGATAETIDFSANFGVLSATTANDTSHGAYSGSNLLIGYLPNGAGVYSVVPNDNDFINTRVENPSAKVLYMDVIVGTGTTTGTTSYAANTGVVIVSVDADGKYHFTLNSSIQMNKALDVQGGVSGAPSTITFTMSNIHDL